MVEEEDLRCDKEITNTELMIKEKTEKSNDADSTITQLTEKIQSLKNGIEENQAFIATTEDEIASRTEVRNAATLKGFRFLAISTRRDLSGSQHSQV